MTKNATSWQSQQYDAESEAFGTIEYTPGAFAARIEHEYAEFINSLNKSGATTLTQAESAAFGEALNSAEILERRLAHDKPYSTTIGVHTYIKEPIGESFADADDPTKLVTLSQILRHLMPITPPVALPTRTPQFLTHLTRSNRLRLTFAALAAKTPIPPIPKTFAAKVLDLCLNSGSIGPTSYAFRACHDVLSNDADAASLFIAVNNANGGTNLDALVKPPNPSYKLVCYTYDVADDHINIDLKPPFPIGDLLINSLTTIHSTLSFIDLRKHRLTDADVQAAKIAGIIQLYRPAPNTYLSVPYQVYFAYEAACQHYIDAVLTSYARTRTLAPPLQYADFQEPPPDVWLTKDDGAYDAIPFAEWGFHNHGLVSKGRLPSIYEVLFEKAAAAHLDGDTIYTSAQLRKVYYPANINAALKAGAITRVAYGKYQLTFLSAPASQHYAPLHVGAEFGGCATNLTNTNEEKIDGIEAKPPTNNKGAADEKTTGIKAADEQTNTKKITRADIGVVNKIGDDFKW